MRFLIVRLSALGDTVNTLPSASALKESFPGCEIVWAVDPRFAGIVECCASVDRVVRLKPGLSRESRRVEGEFDAAFDLQGLLKSAIVIGAAKAKSKLGFHWQREGARLFSSPVMPDPKSWHVVDQIVDVVRSYAHVQGAPVPEIARFDTAPKDEDLAMVRAKLAERDVDPAAFALLNAGAGWATKRWPPAHFAHLANGLQAHGLRPVFLGGKAEADRAAFAEVIGAGAASAVSMVGETGVRELVALVSLARLHVGGDTGSTHLAAALGVPAVGLYSITRPERCAPYGQSERCLYDPRGLASIAPEAVLRRALEAGETGVGANIQA